ncbi:hypothetical protein GCM10010862_08270 [Devosia nitrariae]|uniref:Uncharacterized protein n=2 Tax=Devosia nitrariae TaxID=2071872 RepID=A0ABQ5W153_9HYPH|nr:hypothetical protein GCM10010862_08270 [Devosia nitrariae]
MSPEIAVDPDRVVEIATRYPEIEIAALAERFGCSDRQIRYILDRAGIERTTEPMGIVKTVDPHPWRPRSRRRATLPKMTKAEKTALVDAFLAKNEIKKVPRGAMTTGNVIFLDQTRND